MLELAAIVVVAAVALTFVLDATSGAAKMVRPGRKHRGSIHVADSEHSA